MQKNRAAALALIKTNEGGFVDDPRDPGGATNYGIIRATLSRWLHRPASVLDVRHMSWATASQIYEQMFFGPVRFDDLPAGLDVAVVDEAVQSGPGRAAKDLQRLVGARVDGAIGPKTVAAAHTYTLVVGADHAVNAYCDARLGFLRQLRIWASFRAGLAARVARTRAAALRAAA